ncbi:Conserved hypothetical protein [Clostridium neonatale]|nr:Conserved hypothetical protein [Clostridium neonatale]
MVSTSISKVREFDNMVNYDKNELYKLNKDELIKEILKLKEEKQIQEDFC